MPALATSTWAPFYISALASEVGDSGLGKDATLRLRKLPRSERASQAGIALPTSKRSHFRPEPPGTRCASGHVMSTRFTYRNLEVWTLGMDLVEACYKTTTLFPRSELYGLTS